jgi:Acetyltransferase (GNAT) domain
MGSARARAAGRGLSPRYPIRTAHLDLRPHRRDDLEDVFAFHSQPDVVRYVPWPVRDREQTRIALEGKLGQDAVTEPGQWLVLAMELRETSTVIGEVLLKWESESNRQGEIGFALDAGWRRRRPRRYSDWVSRTLLCTESLPCALTPTRTRYASCAASVCSKRRACVTTCFSRVNGPTSWSTAFSMTNGALTGGEIGRLGRAESPSNDHLPAFTQFCSR